ncbi:hypothetical protein ACP70R_013381 [Stipagrostis hirtigluma subsp. patula]
MAECPDLFPVAERGTEGLDMYSAAASGAGVKHVLKVSTSAYKLEDFYAVGQYDDGARGSCADSRHWRRIDHGHLYAAKTFFDARRNRQVPWAWVNESDSEGDGRRGDRDAAEETRRPAGRQGPGPRPTAEPRCAVCREARVRATRRRAIRAAGDGKGELTGAQKVFDEMSKRKEREGRKD